MAPATTEVGTARPAIELVWKGSASTKFRAPRVRREAVARDTLLQRARAFVMEKRVTLVQAPAGAGKSTLMAQLVSGDLPASIVWLSLDEDDNDANRLFASLLTALKSVELEWETDPKFVAAQVTGADEPSRAAVNVLVNALCSFEGERLLIALDDLHRITDPGALKLLDYLVDRLPPEVGLLTGTRVAPELSLARWRSRGELGELHMNDLQFDEHDAQALANLRLGNVEPKLVRDALQRTQGWVAGLQLMFGSSRQASSLAQGEADRHTFDFLAHEVVADLPRELREFAMRCSVLPELSPALCSAVTGSTVHSLLDELYRRNLFLTVIDDVTPTLRFHDLFRAFLQQELERLVSAPEVRELHARAAQAETVPARAISHWLKAEMWDVAVEAIGRCAEPLIAEGGHAQVERWLRQLPATYQDNRPDVAHLLTLCAWARYDHKYGRRMLERATTLYRERHDHAGLARTLPLLARMHTYTGQLDLCDRIIEECAGLNLDAGSRAALSGVRALNATACGRSSEVVTSLRDLVELAQRDPTVLFPAVADFFNAFMSDVPGAAAQLRALKALCVHAEQVRPVHWQVSLMAHSGWPAFCHGDYSMATAALAEREQFQLRHNNLPATWLDISQLRAVHLTASGKLREAVDHIEKSVNLLRTSEIAELREAWLRPVIVDAARFAWCAEDAQALRRFLSALTAPRTPVEWPALDTSVALTRGRCALVEGRLDVAERELLEACRLFEHWKHLTYMADPRIALAFLRIAQARPRDAWMTFAPVWELALQDDAVGHLLLEPPARLSALLATMPESLRQQPATRELLARIASWKQAPERERKRASAVASAMAMLTEREYEVLARIGAGDSNKLIARSLNLSPHTVKRHVANILGKLNVATRGAAATLFRQG